MSIDVVTLVYSRQVGSPVRKAVLLYCADRAGADGRGIYPSKQTMACVTEFGVSSVRRAIAEFVAEGIFEKVDNRPHARGFVVEYRVCLAKLAALPPAIPPAKTEDQPLPQREPNRHITTKEPSLTIVPGAEPSRQKKTRLPEGWVPNEKNLEDAERLLGVGRFDARITH